MQFLGIDELITVNQNLKNQNRIMYLTASPLSELSV